MHSGEFGFGVPSQKCLDARLELFGCVGGPQALHEADAVLIHDEREARVGAHLVGREPCLLQEFTPHTAFDIDAAIAHFRGIEPEEFAAFVTKLAERHVSGMATETRAVPGFTVASEKRAV